MLRVDSLAYDASGVAAMVLSSTPTVVHIFGPATAMSIRRFSLGGLRHSC